MNELELTGRARTHVVQLDAPRCALHRDAVAPFTALRQAASAAGIDLAVASSFRDFDTQVEIWNRKFRGERVLYSRDGTPLDRAALRDEELVDTILLWSALPGASRHHWGSELDLWDCAAVATNYRVQLLPEEYARGGVFERLVEWLDANLERYDFFRPYDRYRGGVAPEPWHVSYAPVSVPAMKLLTPELIAAVLRDTELLGKDLVLARLDALYTSYVANVAEPGTGRA